MVPLIQESINADLYMGKSEATEKFVVKQLDDDSSVQIENQPWKDIGRQMADEIIDDFSKITEADRVGGSLDTPGDIEIITEDGSTVYIETKFVKERSGTLANLWGDALTELGQLEDAMSWSEFREYTNHAGWVNSHLNRFDYPPTLDLPEKNKTTRYKKAKHLKRMIGHSGKNTDNTAKKIIKESNTTDDQRLASEIIINITNLDTEEKINYLQYLDQKDQNSLEIKRFAILLILGIHTKNKIKSFDDTDIEEFQPETAEYIIYRGVRKNNSIIKLNPDDFVDRLTDKEFSYRFDEDNTSIKILTEWEGEKKPILSASLNWGNKFQGIQNDSIRIFVSKILKELEDEETTIPG